MNEGSGQGAERRRYPRFDLIAQVRVKRGREDVIMELSNISASGALFDMGTITRPSWIAIGRELEVGIVHPVDFDTVELVGRIARIVEDHTGVSVAVDFEALEGASRTGLERLLSLARTPAPAPPPLPKGG
jgi:hypothetical protein